MAFVSLPAYAGRKEVAMNRRLLATGLMAAICFSLVACENAQKTAAQAALTLAQKAVDSFETSDAAKFLPGQAKDIQNTLRTAKEAFAKGDYSGALGAAKSLPGKVKDASEAWNTQKQEFSYQVQRVERKDACTVCGGAIEDRLATEVA